MKYKNILITGGAGFIGSFLVDELIRKGYKTRIFDNLEKQVHLGKIPFYLNKQAEFIKGDVRSYKTMFEAIKGIDVVFHLAATVGVAQSNYEIKKFTDSNIGGMANLLDILVNTKHKVKKMIINSSMTGLGEGHYKCKKCGFVRPPLRTEEQLQKGDWHMKCPKCRGKIDPVATPEDAVEYPNSIYAITKKTQADMLMLFGKTYHIPTVSLRCFNVYGPRQSLSNPYTGVTAIFISRIKNDQPAIVYEDGLQSRDFISVHDVVDALLLTLEENSADYLVLNMGSGHPTTIKEIAEIISKLLGKPGMVRLSQEFRKNDIRHCFADMSKTQKLLGWKPKVTLTKGFKELIEWSVNEKAVDKFSDAVKELKTKGLIASE